MTNVAPESTGIINPEIAVPKAIKHHIIHHDTIGFILVQFSLSELGRWIRFSHSS